MRVREWRERAEKEREKEKHAGGKKEHMCVGHGFYEYGEVFAISNVEGGNLGRI